MNASTTKRRLPRFKLQSLFVVVLIAAAYFGCWDATKRRGVDDVVEHFLAIKDYDFRVEFHRRNLPTTAEVWVPFIITVDPNGSPRTGYFWFFGYVKRLGP